jgi:hypothetical protein
MAQTIVEKIAQSHMAEGPNRPCAPEIFSPSAPTM